MKVLHERLGQGPGARLRFTDEARATAQLQHPGIVPIHDFGTLPDGRPWFTMKEIRGRTLAAVITEVHDGIGWEFKRLIAAFLQVCQTVAYAHERGVVHRDLKPDNVMIGRHGEVQVLDWGVAKILGAPSIPVDVDVEGGPEASLVRSGSAATRMGTVTGTPSYMRRSRRGG